MKNNILVIFALAHIFCCACFAAEKLNIGVAEFSSENVPMSDAVAIGNFFRTGLVNTNLFNVLERNNMDMILGEQKFQLSGCTDFNCAVKLGKLLNVQKMIIGNVTKFGGEYYITASVVDVESGKITHSEKVSCKKQFEMPGRAEDLAVLIAEGMTAKESQNTLYMRRKILKNSLRVNIGSFSFLGDLKNVAASALNYNVSYRRQGIPFIGGYNAYTEVEAGYFSVARQKDASNNTDYNIDYYPASANIQYYIPLSFMCEVYTKTGIGVSYGNSKVTSTFLGTVKSDSSTDPFAKIGFGIDLERSYSVGFQIEVLYNYYAMQNTPLSGYTINGGLSYNW